MKKIFYTLLIYMACLQVGYAQQACLSKLSSRLRQYVLAERTTQRSSAGAKGMMARERQAAPLTMAFVKTEGDGEQLLRKEGCKVWTKWGHVYVASVPLGSIARLSLHPQVMRIEANQGQSCLMDSAVIQSNAIPVYEGRSLPQAFTGKGVVMGIMDIGFDLTHPNFFDSQMRNYRIKALWDQLYPSADDGSDLPVGREFTGKEVLLSIGRSVDGKTETHGTHTLGIAAGSGGEGVPQELPGKYHGMAYESDICLVANLTTENRAYVDSAQYALYTYATDALGFKYIFDYADKAGEPCVISFSEGSREDFSEDNVLFEEVLDSLTSTPGHIIVSSAGNNNLAAYSYAHKPVGVESAGFFSWKWGGHVVYHIAKSKSPFTFRNTFYTGTSPQVLEVSTAEVLAAPDSTYTATCEVGGEKYTLTIGAYNSFPDKDEICYDWIIQTDASNPNPHLGKNPEISFEIVGREADVEVYQRIGDICHSSTDPTLDAGEKSHNINVPASLKSVISVGATVNRTYTVDTQGGKQNVVGLPIGSCASYSSVGPSASGLTKPEVMAPGTNVISSYSSYYEENNPENDDVVKSDVARFTYQGRTYAWNSNTGTSMASPVVGGAVALWLQANPKLTRQDVLDIIAKTSHPLDTESEVPNNRWGYGLIDVYGGLLAALQVDGISGVSHHQPRRAQVGIVGDVLKIWLDEQAEHPFTVSLYNTAGIKLLSQGMSQGERNYAIDLSRYPSDIYIVQITGYPAIMGSSVVRKD